MDHADHLGRLLVASTRTYTFSAISRDDEGGDGVMFDLAMGWDAPRGGWDALAVITQHFPFHRLGDKQFSAQLEFESAHRRSLAQHRLLFSAQVLWRDGQILWSARQAAVRFDFGGSITQDHLGKAVRGLAVHSTIEKGLDTPSSLSSSDQQQFDSLVCSTHVCTSRRGTHTPADSHCNPPRLYLIPS